MHPKLRKVIFGTFWVDKTDRLSGRRLAYSGKLATCRQLIPNKSPASFQLWWRCQQIIADCHSKVGSNLLQTS